MKKQKLLLLPGLDGTDVFLRPLMEALQPKLETIVVSFPNSRLNDYESLLEFVGQTTENLTEIYVLGSSFSGPLAVKLAAANPERVKGLILSATFVTSPRPRLSHFRFAMRTPVLAALRLIRRLPVWLGHAPSDPLRMTKAETWTRVTPTALAVRTRALLAVDVRSELRRCQQPLLCMTFDDDNVVSLQSSEEILREAPHARRAKLPGKHFTHYHNPVPVAQAILSFIAENEDSAGKD